MAPSLPARKAGGKRTAAPSSKSLPILQAQNITLEDGTQIPVKIPPGMPPAQAQALLAYLKSNPEAAKQALEQAQMLAKSPGLANAFMNMQTSMTPDAAEKYMALKDDPEFKTIFEDVQNNGPAAFKKYWDDTELMSKIAQKMRTLNLQQQELPKEGSAGEEGSKTGPVKPQAPGTLHDAAKFGAVDAALKLIEEGKDVNEKSDKGITPLGIAVGFNRLEMVKLLLEKGADVSITDGKGNTVLHYAAGYGRKEVAEVLLAAGAKIDVLNDAKQKPIDVAKLNKEKHMVEFLKEKMLQSA